MKTVLFIYKYALRKPNAPVIFMSTHSGNIIAFNANTPNAAIITSDLVDLTQDPLDSIQRHGDIRFRQMFIVKFYLFSA